MTSEDDDRAKLIELMDGMYIAARPNATLIRVDVAGGEYWDTPGGKVTSLLSLAKTKLTGETCDADHGTADL